MFTVFFSFAIFGNGRLYEYLCYQHDFFVSKKLRNYSFSIEVVDKMEYKNSKRLLDGKEEFIRDGSYFIYNFNGASVRFDGSMELKMQKKIEIDEGFSKMKANTIIDMFFRIFNLKNEVYLVHAACIEKENKGVLVPAWKGMGKTNACLEFVKEGFSFLADDKVWVGVDKKVYSYPRYVVIKGDDNFEFIDKLRVREKLRLVFRFILSKLFNLKRRPISIVVNMLAKPLVKYYRIQELFDQCQTIASSELNEVLYLSKDSCGTKFIKEKTNPSLVSKKISRIAYVEWNMELLKIASAHDILFPEEESWMNELKLFFEMEENNIADSLKSIKCNNIIIPEKKEYINWENFYVTVK